MIEIRNYEYRKNIIRNTILSLRSYVTYITADRTDGQCSHGD